MDGDLNISGAIHQIFEFLSKAWDMDEILFFERGVPLRGFIFITQAVDQN